MKTMFDTSVLVPALLSRHPNHAIASDWLRRAKQGEFAWFITSHSLAECYATLTARSATLNVAPAIVAESIRTTLVGGGATIIELSTTDYVTAIDTVASLNLWSGIIFDALLVTAARKAGIERLLTYNQKHFLRLTPQGDVNIVVP